MRELGDFRFKDNFEGLTDTQFQQALSAVNAQFTGVYSLWSSLTPGVTAAKRSLCIDYLVGWWLMNEYPDSAVTGSGTGGMPIASKKIGPIFLKYKDTVRQAGSGVLDLLTTNSYGLQALQMIQSAPENYQVYA